MRRIAFALAAILVTAACDNKLTGSVNPEDAGTYVLRSINDTALPFPLLVTTDLSLYVTADTIFMGVNGTFTDRTYYRRVRPSGTDFPRDSITGTWLVRGASVTFTGTNGQTFAATLSAQQLIMVGEGLRSTYSK